MLNYIWFAMIVIGFVVGAVNGRMGEVADAVMKSAGTAIELSMSLLGIMCLWTGLMGIAEKGGLIKIITRLIRPLIRALFPGIPMKHPASGAIVMNLAANFFGLGNAATPLGLKAMNEMQKMNPSKETATDAMSMFLVLNTAVVQLIPVTIIAIRMNAGSVSPAAIIGPIWFATLCASVAGIISVKAFTAFEKRTGRKKIDIKEENRYKNGYKKDRYIGNK